MIEGPPPSSAESPLPSLFEQRLPSSPSLDPDPPPRAVSAQIGRPPSFVEIGRSPFSSLPDLLLDGGVRSLFPESLSSFFLTDLPSQRSFVEDIPPLH